MLENGFVLLHRSLLKWEWYGDLPTTRLFVPVSYTHLGQEAVSSSLATRTIKKTVDFCRRFFYRLHHSQRQKIFALSDEKESSHLLEEKISIFYRLHLDEGMQNCKISDRISSYLI